MRENTKNKEEIDNEFVLTQLKLRFNDDSVSVLNAIFKFDVDLIKYFSVRELSKHLVESVFDKTSNEWMNCKKHAIEMLFTNIYSHYSKTKSGLAEVKSQFIDALIDISTKIMEQKLLDLLKLISESKFFKDEKIKANVNEFYDGLKSWISSKNQSYVDEESSELMNFNANKVELRTFFAFDLYLHSLEVKTTSKQDNLTTNCFKILKYFQLKCDFKEKIDLKSIADSTNKSIDDYLSTLSANKIKVNTFLKLFNRYLQVGNQLKTENDSVFEYLCVNSAKTPVFVYLIEQFINLNLKKSTLFFTYLHKYLIKSEKLEVASCEGKNRHENFSNEISKLRSLQLLNKYIQEKHLLNEEPLLVNTYVLTLTSCLTSNYEQIRKEALNCLNKIQTQLTSNVHQQQEIEKQESTSIWYNFIKKLLKHSQEIIFDANYLANSQLNKIVSSNILTEINGIISKCSKPELIVYLNLLRKLKDDQKFEFIDSLTSILSEKSGQESQVVEVVLNNFVVNSKTSEYFNKNSHKFDEMIKYLSESDEYRNILLKQFEIYSEEFYQALNETHKLRLLDTLFNNLCVNKKDTSSDKSEYKQIFANLIQDSKYFVYLLDKYLPELKDTEASTSEQAKTTKQMKKQMITESTTQQKPALVINFNYLKQIIELLQLKLTDCDNEKKKSISGSLVLIPRLFTILSTLNDSQDKNDNSEYLQICSLNCIQLIYNYESKSKSDLNEKQFNIELLMQILKKTTTSDQSMQVQQQILLLLSDLAHLFPDKILQNVLVMFVFVGDKLARKDDLYSFHIMNKTIKTLLPAILNAKLSDKEKNQEARDAADNAIHSNLDEIKPKLSKIVCKILQSFVITLPHIPAHRKWSIFSELLTIIGINNYLWITIIQSFDSYIVQKRDEDDRKLRDTLKQCMGMLQAIFVKFDLDNILQSAVYLIEFLNDYMTQCMFSMNDGALLKKAEIRNRYEYLGGLQFDEYSAINNKYFIYNLLVFVNELLVNGQFQEKLNSSMNGNTNKLFEILLEKILFNILYLNKAQHKPKNNEDDVKFLRALLNKFYDCMENVINSLDSQQFIEIIRKLLKHEQYQIKRRVLALLNNKLRKQEPNDKEISHLLTMIDDLLEAIQINNEPVDVEINNQTILFSIKLLCKRIGEQNQLAFMKVLKFVCENLINKANYTTTLAGNQQIKLKNTNLLSSVLLCLGELCLKLKSSSLIYLNKIMNFTLEVVQFEDTLNYDLLLLSCVTCLLKIIQNLANFLSPYLKKLLFISCSLSSMLTNKLKQQQLLPAAAAMLTSNISISSDIGIDIEAYINSQTNATSTSIATNKTLQQLELKLQQLRTSLATSIPLRLLAPLLNDESITFNDNMKLDNIEYYMQLTRHSIKISAQDDIVANLKPLRTMFMNLFNLRTLNANTKSPNDLCKFEDHLIDTYCELTYKLSEETFRPIFFKFFEWSTMNDPPKDRLITFYRTTFKLSDKLKSLFVLFSSHFLQNSIQTLDLLNKSKTEENYFLNKKDRTKYVYSNEKSRLLLCSCVDTLKNLFLYDTDKFLLSNDRFNIIMQPLVDQIENETDFDNYKSFISEHLIPCMANFAALCIHDTTLCRKLNYQILLKTKHSSVQVRLATLDVLHKVSKQMGDLYNSIFTETAPFLAELMEDPVEEVEEKVQFVIKELEDMLGESLQGHFV